MTAETDPGGLLDRTDAERLAGEVAFDARGLVPAVAQDAVSGEVLMLAWMSPAALIATLTTGRATYYSRSRDRLWRKGDSSGHIQVVRDVRLDCDGDSVLVRVDQHGPACHTGAPVCFYRRATPTGWATAARAAGA